MTKTKNDVITKEEKAAMRALVKERKEAGTKEDMRRACEEAIAAMPPGGREMGERVHKLITDNAPGLSPKTWYGMPAYMNADGKVVIFFRGAEKFKERYMTFGFNQEAELDEAGMWPIAYAITDLSPANEKRIAELVKKAVS